MDWKEEPQQVLENFGGHSKKGVVYSNFNGKPLKA